MTYISNLSPAEEYRLNGTLSCETIETLLESHAKFEAVQDVGNLDEARGCFPEEDCLQEHIEDLRRVAKGMRGDNRALLLGLAEELEDTQAEIAVASEYGISEIKAYLKQFY